MNYDILFHSKVNIKLIPFEISTAQPLAALTKGVGLPPVGQESTMPDTHEAMRHHVEQETPERPF
jgi:hypothetical protein